MVSQHLPSTSSHCPSHTLILSFPALDRAAERCINVLLDLIQTKVNYVVQEAIVVIKDIFRKYPNRYESIIATLCENLEDLDEPEAKVHTLFTSSLCT